MIKYQHILYAIDLKDDVSKELGKVIEAAKEIRAKITLVHYVRSVINWYGEYTFIAPENAILTFENEMKEKAKNKLASIITHFKYENINIVIEVSEEPKQDILQLSKSLNVDAIYLNGHHHNVLGRLGSVADYVINQASCDVVVLK